jgi:Ca-activated chloride channel family protein
MTAAEIAREMGIKLYTIGLGTNGSALFPVGQYANGQWKFEYKPVEIDEVLLKKIASETGGQYFRATSNTKLKKIYNEINKMEKTKIEEFKYYNYSEQFRLLVILAGLLLLLEVLLRFTIFKSFI